MNSPLFNFLSTAEHKDEVFDNLKGASLGLPVVLHCKLWHSI